MRGIIFFIALILYFSSSISQNRYVKLDITKKDSPTYIYNKKIIGNEIEIPNKDLISEIYILKDKPDKKRDKFFNLTEQGILFVDLKKKLKSTSQQELISCFGLKQKGKIFIDGYLLDNKYYEIATNSIITVDVINPNSKNGLEEKALNIWTVNKYARFDNFEKAQNPDLFNVYFEYTPNNSIKAGFCSNLEKRTETRLNSISKLFMFYLKKDELNISDKELITLDKHTRELADNIFKDNIKIILKGAMSHGCTNVIKKKAGNKTFIELYYCYGDITENDENILHFFKVFNHKMQTLK